MRTTLACCLLLPCLLAQTGCRLTTPSPDPELAAKLSALPYPAQAPLGDDLDIVVVRDDRQVRLINRTPRAYLRQQLWLNQQYVGLVEELAIGTDNTFSLVDCINEHGEAFPVGGLLQPERSYPIVLAELFDPTTGKRHRLVSRLPRD